jgi:hypothetical protein
MVPPINVWLFVFVGLLLSPVARADGDAVCDQVQVLEKEHWSTVFEKLLARTIVTEEICAALQVEEEWFLEGITGYMCGFAGNTKGC